MTTTHTARQAGRLSPKAQRFADAYDEASQSPKLLPLVEELDRLHSMERRAQYLKERSSNPDVPDLGIIGEVAAEFVLTPWSDFA